MGTRKDLRRKDIEILLEKAKRKSLQKKQSRRRKGLESQFEEKSINILKRIKNDPDLFYSCRPTISRINNFYKKYTLLIQMFYILSHFRLNFYISFYYCCTSLLLKMLLKNAGMLPINVSK